MLRLWTSHRQEVSHLGRAKTVQPRREEEARRIRKTHPARQPETHNAVGAGRSDQERFDEFILKFPVPFEEMTFYPNKYSHFNRICH